MKTIYRSPLVATLLTSFVTTRLPAQSNGQTSTPANLVDALRRSRQRGPIPGRCLAGPAPTGALGTIKVKHLASNSPEANKVLPFNPGNVPDGISLADPMLKMRAAAYLISVQERR